MKLRIWDLREDRDLTQKEVAALLHCDQSLYSKYERGERLLPLDLAIRLADYYGVSLDYLTGRTPYPLDRKKKERISALFFPLCRSVIVPVVVIVIIVVVIVVPVEFVVFILLVVLVVPVGFVAVMFQDCAVCGKDFVLILPAIGNELHQVDLPAVLPVCPEAQGIGLLHAGMVQCNTLGLAARRCPCHG